MMAAAELPVVAVDASFAAPADLWTSRAPGSMNGAVPVRRTVAGADCWLVDDQLWSAGRGGDESVATRLATLDAHGIAAQVLCPGGTGYAVRHAFGVRDAAVRATVLRIYNDFLVDVQRESAGRLFPQAVLPTWDIDLTVAEMTRLLDAGIRGFTVSERLDQLGAGELFESYFNPMWELFNSSGAVVNLHGGPDRPAGERATVAAGHDAQMRNVRIVANLCLSNLFSRFPDLRIVVTGSGLGRRRYLLGALEFLLRDIASGADERQLTRLRPSDYLREHLYLVTSPDPVGLCGLVDVVGSRNLLVESAEADLAVEQGNDRFASVLSGQEPDVRRDVLRDNAVRLYRLDRLVFEAPLDGRSGISVR